MPQSERFASIGTNFERIFVKSTFNEYTKMLNVEIRQIRRRLLQTNGTPAGRIQNDPFGATNDETEPRNYRRPRRIFSDVRASHLLNSCGIHLHYHPHGGLRHHQHLVDIVGTYCGVLVGFSVNPPDPTEPPTKDGRTPNGPTKARKRGSLTGRCSSRRKVTTLRPKDPIPRF